MKVLIIDDSSFFRISVKEAIRNLEEIDKIKLSSNGKMALEELERNHYDLIILDIEMPILDGIEFLKEFQSKKQDTKIIMYSSLTTNEAEKTIEALSLGASDFATKTTNVSSPEEGIRSIDETLVPKIKALFRLDKKITKTQATKAAAPTTVKSSSLTNFNPNIICMGSSTGGPEALRQVFSNINKVIPMPIVLVQHMPPQFTTKLADSLNKLSPVHVVEAKEDDVLKPNTCYIAPGDYHMEVISIADQYKITLNQNEKVCYVRPAVDVTFQSIVRHQDFRAVGIVLTGMGQDGLNGSIKFKEKNFPIIIQDEASSVVWGMPGAIAQNGSYDKITDLSGVSAYLNTLGV
ncbi:MAG: chemotaxis-specific protein-glutamate methyltransferase CheB [Bacteriovoracaceae bacterium]